MMKKFLISMGVAYSPANNCWYWYCNCEECVAAARRKGQRNGYGPFASEAEARHDLEQTLIELTGLEVEVTNPEFYSPEWGCKVSQNMIAFRHWVAQHGLPRQEEAINDER
jgi:hypothetical protein